jgi:HlyD family secretion protein
VLLPGMNGEVTVYINQQRGVLAVPLDAVRTAREMTAAASALGMDPDSAKAQIERQMAARREARAAADSTRGRPAMAAGGSSGGGASSGTTGAWRQRRNAARAGGSGLGSPAGGPPPGAGPPPDGGPPPDVTSKDAGSGTGTSGRQAHVVFVKTSRGFEARLVRLGISDYDYSQVLAGLEEGDEVALLGVAVAQAKRESDQAQLRQRMGSGMPGVGGTTRASSGGRASAGGGH